MSSRRDPWRALWDDPSAWLTVDHPALERASDLDRVRALLGVWAAPDDAQAAERDRILAFVAEHPTDAHRRECLAGHLTGSALVLDPSGERALLMHHKKLDRWLQLGGHADGEANLVRVALDEATEESGIEDLAIHPVPIDVDVHVIPERPARRGRPAEPEHLHLDVRFLVRAPHERCAKNDESHELAWFGPGDLDSGSIDVDDSVRRLFRAGFG